MKSILSIPLWILLLAGYFPSLAQDKPVTTKQAKLEVYYFHATRRCATCMAIEDNTKKTLDTYFAAEIKDGTIKFNVVNVDEKKNKALAEKYEASGSALFLTKLDQGKEQKTDMTDFAFSYGRNNPEKFMAGLKDKINELLK
jgi:hypothetical protein